jgi:hypothetical protein
MSDCLHFPHRNLCDETTVTGDNVHRCFLDKDHAPHDRHTCVCFYVWTANDDAEGGPA